jgi:integrating conjugative element protein (TIGR03749 family)
MMETNNMKTTSEESLPNWALVAAALATIVTLCFASVGAYAQETVPNPAILGVVPTPASNTAQAASTQQPPAATAPQQQLGVVAPAMPSSVDTTPIPDSDRLIYQRVPLRVGLAVNRERLIGFPGIVALHTPEGFEALAQTQIIDRTVYIKALAPFNAIRVIAEEIHTGRKIPLDFVAETVKAPSAAQYRPLEILVSGTNTQGPAASTIGDARPSTREPAPSHDMVALTRHAAQALYAPTRLIPNTAGVTQVSVNAGAVQGLYRGWRIETAPIGAWRSGQLTVTAVRFRNQSAGAQDLDLQEIRGSWLAATAQHTRLLAAGSQWDTTVVYLVCDKPNFDACR